MPYFIILFFRNDMKTATQVDIWVFTERKYNTKPALCLTLHCFVYCTRIEDPRIITTKRVKDHISNSHKTSQIAPHTNCEKSGHPCKINSELKSCETFFLLKHPFQVLNQFGTFSQSAAMILPCSDIWMNEYGCITTSRHSTTEKYDNNWKGWHYRFHDDNPMSYRYILAIA